MYAVRVITRGGHDVAVTMSESIQTALQTMSDEVSKLPKEMKQVLAIRYSKITVQGVVGSTVMADITLFEEPR